jgi:Family of unknown function (DUF6496)
MAKQTKAQKETVERVMHEFKHGELETSAGDTVKSRRQAIAIGLSEAGASNQQSPAENKRRLAKTKRQERGDGPTKAELYAQAKKQNIPGRSKMNKGELARAVKD